MIVTAYGRFEGRDIKRLTLDVSDEHAQVLDEMALHVAAESPEFPDTVVFVMRVPSLQALPMMEIADANHDG